MGYCPRCGENSAFGAGSTGREGEGRATALRIPAGSRIVHLPQIGDEAEQTVRYGGTRFRVTREDDYLVLTPLE